MARTRPLAFLLTLLCAGGLAGAPALAAGSPSGNQIAAAIAAAQRSPHLWATVNICDTRAHPQTIGIRAQMPGLGFPARLSLLIEVEYWNAGSHQFAVDPGTRYSVPLGVVSSGYEQGGHNFSFSPHAGKLSGVVTFQWRRSGRLLLSLSRRTTSGHHGADGADPPGHSAATCTIR